MGVHEWESGTIVLPRHAYERFRVAVRDAARQHYAKLAKVGQECWDSLTDQQRADEGAYRRAVADWFDAERSKVNEQYRKLPWSASDRTTMPLRDRLDDLYTAEEHMDERMYWPDIEPMSRPDMTDFRRLNDDETWFANADCAVTFDAGAHTVKWDVSYDKNAIERAGSSWLGRAFHHQLRNVLWDEGTGGVLKANNEERTFGRDTPPYVTTGFGPLGAAEAPDRTAPYQTSRSRGWVRPQDGAQQGRRPAGSPGSSGGQFTSRTYGDPGNGVLR